MCCCASGDEAGQQLLVLLLSPGLWMDAAIAFTEQDDLADALCLLHMVVYYADNFVFSNAPE